MFRADREELGNWPEWCYCPLSAAYAIVSGGGSVTCDLNNIADVARLGALAAWRPSQVIYRFDPVISAALIKTPIDKLPVTALYRLPAWCVYIEAPDIDWFGKAVYGFFAHLEHDANSGRAELRILYDTSDGLIAQPIHISHNTLDEAVEAALLESKRQMINSGRTMTAARIPANLHTLLAETVRPALSLLLYLCSEQADLSHVPEVARPKKTKKGWKLFPPNTPSYVEVGVRIGAAIRRAYLADQTNTTPDRDQNGRAQPRPHVRIAHWHTYRTGQGRTSSIIKRLPPIPVNVEMGNIPVTIKNIKK